MPSPAFVTQAEPKIFVKLSELLDCLEERLPAPVCSLAVQTGDAVAYDFWPEDCEYDGMAWVRLMSTYVSVQFPTAYFGPLPQAWKWAYSFELGIARSFPLADEDGNVNLNDEILTEKARLQMMDMEAMRQALLCCFEGDQVYIGNYTPNGPEGGAVGGTFEGAVSL